MLIALADIGYSLIWYAIC